jgi:glycosyltransferase involved in cell wall biosynthesis
LVVLHDASSRFTSGIPLVRALAARAKSVVAPSRFIARDFTDTVGGAENEIQVIENGVEEELFLGVPQIDDSPMPLLLSAGRLVPEKGAHLLIKAVSILATKGTSVRLAIAGAGPELAMLKHLASELKVFDLIDFLGWLPRAALANAFAKATVVIVPSIEQEPFGLIAAEAAMAGRPVIAARVGALPEIVEDQRTGILFEPDNSLDLANAIQRVLGSPGLAAQLGATARSRAQDRYMLSSMVDRYESLYARLINEYPCRP